MTALPVLAVAAILSVLLASSARAADRQIDHVTAGLAGEPHFVDATPDGSAVLVDTVAALDPADTNGREDFYVRRAGRWTLITSGTAPQRTIPQFRYVGMSRDGSHVVFTTDDKLSPEDTDDQADLYESVNGRIRMVAAGNSTSFGHISADGERIYFTTTEQLVAADRDALQDLYVREAGQTRLLSLADGTPATSLFAARGENGRDEYIESTERLDPADQDSCADIYQRNSGFLLLVTPDGQVGAACRDHRFLGATWNGAHVFYDEGGVGTIFRTTCGLSTTAVLPAVPPYAKAELTGFTQDGSRAFLITDRQLVPSDTDTYADAYRWDAGGLTLLSVGPAGGNGAFSVKGRPSGDGSRFAFTTSEFLTPDDVPSGNTDPSNEDVFLRTGSGTSLVSKGTGTVAMGQGFDGISDNGRRILFGSSDGLWEWVDGSLQRLSTGPNGASAQVATVARSEDIQHIFFTTNTGLVADDTDGMIDIFDSYLPSRPSGPPDHPASPCPHLASGTGGKGLRLTRARVTPRRFHRGRRLPRVQKAARIGARIRFRLSDKARVTLSFARRTRRPGRKARWRSAGHLRVQGRKGTNRVRFQGRLTKRKRLKTGRYRITLRATDSQRRKSNVKRARFRLLPRR
jgi:Tol biopolymer transport system component